MVTFWLTHMFILHHGFRREQISQQDFQIETMYLRMLLIFFIIL